MLLRGNGLQHSGREVKPRTRFARQTSALLRAAKVAADDKIQVIRAILRRRDVEDTKHSHRGAPCIGAASGPGRYDEVHFQVGYNMYGNSAFADFADRLRNGHLGTTRQRTSGLPTSVSQRSFGCSRPGEHDNTRVPEVRAAACIEPDCL
jgi:hypothetical protein